MALAYTPGLKVKDAVIVSRERRLPTAGEILVKVGDTVDFDTVVAQAYVPGQAYVLDVAALLGLGSGSEIGPNMLKKVGDRVKKDERIAFCSQLFGLMKYTAKSPCEGTVELISEESGLVAIREPPELVEVKAYIPGVVRQVFPNYGVLVENSATFIQGIFGVGGETFGELIVLGGSGVESLEADKIGSECKGKILVWGGFANGDSLQKAIDVGARGVVVGGIGATDLKHLIGYDIGVAITGQEEIGITLIVTDGFGHMRMSERVLKMLSSFSGRMASINGATQIRAGVMRPEIVIPRPELKISGEGEVTRFDKGMEPGMPVRIIRQPYFGRIGRVLALPPELQVIKTESEARVLDVELGNGTKVTVPRANVEIIEE